MFFGDSITDNWSKPDYGGFFPGKPYVNRGIGGQTTAQMLLRFRADVRRAAAEGRRDPRGNQRHRGQRRPRDARPGAGQPREHGRAGAKPTASGSCWRRSCRCPTTSRTRTARPSPAPGSDRPPRIRELNRWLAAYAAKNGHGYLDYFSATADANGLLLPALNDDGLHPNARGYAVMAPLAEKAIAEALRGPSKP